MEHTEEYRIIDFYSGFEGEGEVILYADNMELHIWDGYFDPIMTYVFYKEIEVYEELFGLNREYHTCTGWCDIKASKTVVEAPKRELAVLESLNIEECTSRYHADMAAYYKESIVEVYEALIKFFREAKGVIYIEED